LRDFEISKTKKRKENKKWKPKHKCY
jgi:hypothetical protein